MLEKSVRIYYNYNIHACKLTKGKQREMKTEKRMFYGKLFTLVLPIAVQNLMTALVSASDAWMLGLQSQNSLSAVSLAAQVQFVLNLFYAALTIGTTILAAQYWGKGEEEAVEMVLAVALKLSVLVSAVFFLAAFLFPQLLMRVFTNEPLLRAAGASYLKAVCWSYLFTSISQIFLCIMKNSGRAFRSTVYGSVSVILNILLNAVLIFGLFGFPRLEIKGAALATVISRGAELGLIILENTRKDKVRIKYQFLKYPDKVLKKDFYQYTNPVMANELVWGCGFTMFTVIMGHLGNDAVAANSIANIVKNIIACMCLGIGAGSGIMIGNELGRGDLAKAKEYGGKLCRISLAAGIVSGLVLLALSPLVLKFAGKLSVQSLEYLKIMLCICAYYMIGKSVNSTIVAGIFCAGGDTRFGLLCDLVTMWLVIVPVGMIAAFVFQLPVLAVYFLLNLDELVKLPAVYRHYRNYHWLRDLTVSKTEGTEADGSFSSETEILCEK